MEQTHLKPLPAWVPEVYELCGRMVDIEGYVALNTNRYSVPVAWLGRHVQVRETKDKVEIQLDVKPTRYATAWMIMFAPPPSTNARLRVDDVGYRRTVCVQNSVSKVSTFNQALLGNFLQAPKLILPRYTQPSNELQLLLEKLRLALPPQPPPRIKTPVPSLPDSVAAPVLW